MSTIYWILAITVMVVLLISSVYNLVTTIKSERAFKKYYENLLKRIIERNEEK